MTTEPTYTDAQIENKATEIKARPYSAAASHLVIADMLRKLLSERQAAMQGQGGEMKRFDTSAEDRFEQFIQAEVDRAPEPLRRLGEYLARVMDDDQFKTAERMLLGIAAIQPPQPVRSVSDEDASAAMKAYVRETGTVGEGLVHIDTEAMRAALEHFAAIAQEKQS